MRVSKIRLGILAAASGLALGGCAYGYDGYGGFGGVSVGYNSGYGYGGYGYDPYGYGYGGGYGGYGYDPYGYGYGSPYGWYDGFYYPGNGIYVYDTYRRRHAWNDRQRDYWQNRTNHWRDRTRTNGTTTTNVGTYTPRENWSGFDRSRTRTDTTGSSGDNGRNRYWGRSSNNSSSRSDNSSNDRANWRGRDRGAKND